MFAHHPASAIPKFERDGVVGSVVIGHFNNLTSPVQFPYPVLCIDLKLDAGTKFRFADLYPERAAYVVSGALKCGGTHYAEQRLLVIAAGQGVTFETDVATHILLIAGERMDGPRHLFWNFVSSRPERIEQAKQGWAAQCFPIVPGETEFIPLP